MHKVVRNAKSKPNIQCWFQVGTKDETSDRDHNGVIDAIQDTTELMDEMALKGFQVGVDMTYFEVEGGEHNQRTWGKALPHFLRWAFPAR
jgi:S-formylglutathione hydrolase FrmB